MSGEGEPPLRWADPNDAARGEDFRAYVHNIAQARLVIRRVLRVVDESAKRNGLDPLLHQALLQIYGSATPIAVHEVGERLDIAAAFASRLVKALEQNGLVRRSASTVDRRVTEIVATSAGADLLRTIDLDVHHRVAYFQHQIGDDQRMAALAIFAFYVGLAADSPVARAILAEPSAAAAAQP